MTTPTTEKIFKEDEKFKLPRPFVLRRLHSILGLWLVFYVFEHLLVNSQAAMFFQNEGYSFVRLVNKIHELPYLHLIEILFLGLPILVHAVWGVIYLRTSKMNSFPSNGNTPALCQYRRNRAFTWQRITSVMLLVGIVLHVIQMRFLDYPTLVHQGDNKYYMVRLKGDGQLFLVAAKLNSQIYTNKRLEEHQVKLLELIDNLTSIEEKDSDAYFAALNAALHAKEWLQGAKKNPLEGTEVLAVTPSAGAAFYLIVRETFKSPLMVVLYSLLVVATAYHAFNGLWTFFITWGITLTRRSQKRLRVITNFLMGVVTILGLMACWGPYWTFIFSK
ncbi:MAG: hypothetical protein ACKVOH_05540 [Chlamydiales bacterium]